MEYIKSEPLIKVIVTGHVHRNLEDLFAGKPQIATKGSYEGDVREIVLC